MDRQSFHEDERESRAPLWRVMCQEFIARYVRDDAYVLDLDSGYCDFINNISARCRIAVDLSSDAVRFAAPSVERHWLTLEDLSQAVEQGIADLAFASNAFEHLYFRPAQYRVGRQMLVVAERPR
jgi:hypothetical protein